jgi:hypothetical protein
MMVGTTKGIPRSATINLGNHTIGGTLPIESSALDDSIAAHRYVNTSTRSEPDESRAGSETPAASVKHRFGARNSSTPLRPQSVAIGQNNNFNHSFTTEFDLRPDLTPTETEPAPIGSAESLSARWSPTPLTSDRHRSNVKLESSALHRPRLQPSPSRPLTGNDLDKVSEHADDEQLEQPTDLSATAAAVHTRKWPTDASGAIVKQRSDSATRRKLTRQQATTGDHQLSGTKGAFGLIGPANSSSEPISVRNRVRSVFRATAVSLILFTTIVACSLWLFFELDAPLLDAWRQTDEAQIVREQFYGPTRDWIQQTLFKVRSSIGALANSFLSN